MTKAKRCFVRPLDTVKNEASDYQESWQPAVMEPELLKEAEGMADAVTKSLGGSGIWGVEFFIQNPRDGKPGTVYFSELSPRPHDTGMVTLAGTQTSEFELHARAVLGLPVRSIDFLRPGQARSCWPLLLWPARRDPSPRFEGWQKLVTHRAATCACLASRRFGPTDAWPSP